MRSSAWETTVPVLESVSGPGMWQSPGLWSRSHRAHTETCEGWMWAQPLVTILETCGRCLENSNWDLDSPFSDLKCRFSVHQCSEGEWWAVMGKVRGDLKEDGETCWRADVSSDMGECWRDMTIGSNGCGLLPTVGMKIKPKSHWVNTGHRGDWDWVVWSWRSFGGVSWAPSSLGRSRWRVEGRDQVPLPNLCWCWQEGLEKACKDFCWQSSCRLSQMSTKAQQAYLSVCSCYQGEFRLFCWCSLCYSFAKGRLHREKWGRNCVRWPLDWG